MRANLALLCLVIASCTDAASGAAEPSARFLWKIYTRNSPTMAGERFLHGEMSSAAVCDEVAEMYNTRPDIAAAGFVGFQCERSGDD